MSDSIIMERVADVAAACFYEELARTEDLSAFESLLSTDMRTVAAGVLRRCMERFDADLRENMPAGWSAHERASRTLVTLVGCVTYVRTVFLDQYGRRRILLDELLGIPPRVRLSACAFIWVATHASELSYRKTAREFFALTSATISHVTVMGVVHREGELLKRADGEFACSSERVSQDALFMESDGLWVHLQEPRHRRTALPRFLYEQARKTKSFELKVAALYAGKAQVAPGRFERGGLCLACTDGDADEFWERAWRMLSENYEPDDVERLSIEGDGAPWCGPERMEERVPKGCAVTFTLDLFHLMQKIARAFPEEGSAQRQWAAHLAMRGKGAALCRMSARCASRMGPGRARDKVEDLADYAGTHAASIRPPRHELGTMEGTNAHVGAARLKGQGRSWSRKGAEAICLIRCALMTGRALMAPPCRAWFTKRETAMADATMPRSASQVPVSVGRGWQPAQHPKSLGKAIAISVSRRS